MGTGGLKIEQSLGGCLYELSLILDLLAKELLCQDVQGCTYQVCLTILRRMGSGLLLCAQRKT